MTSSAPPFAERSDGVVTLRAPSEAEVPVLVAGRDEVFRRFLGDGDPHPWPTACVVVDGSVVGWVDWDHDRTWLLPDEVNVGYGLAPEARGHGYASRAVRLLLQHLADDTDWRVATLLIHPENERSLALARRLEFESAGDLDGNPYWKREVP
ncbi:MAG TPA: GNAT family protein [Ilumatobacteraceae bacterium]|nr:GNAT family protein [Ilumatobacteraceae bacterium]